MITANFIDTSKVYNFCMSGGLGLCLFVINFNAEINALRDLFKVKFATR